MPTYFSFGDEVTHHGELAKVVSVWFDKSGNMQARIIFNDPTLLPREMEVYTSQLTHTKNELDEAERWWAELKGNAVDTNVQCPVCKTKWHVSLFGNNVWRDCLPCGKKREDLVK